MVEFIDKTSEQSGTPINRENMMAIQGMENFDVTFNENDDGSITIIETNGDGQKLTTTVIEDNSGIVITENFNGQKPLSKTTTISNDAKTIAGRIQE